MAQALRTLGRRIRQTFGISAPRMAVRTHLPWSWRVAVLFGLAALVSGMWWWGYDFGKFLAAFDRRVVAQAASADGAAIAAVREENERLRLKIVGLESDLNVTRGSQATLSRQALELQNENTQMKEELAFLRKLFGDAGKPGAFSIQRLSAEKEQDQANVYRFSMLVVRGGNPKDEFSGQLTLLAHVAAAGHSMTLTLPDDQPDTAPALELKFKYYQRVEGTFRIPAGGELRSLQAKVLEPGQPAPKATRSLNLS
jgi:hypothetical protein